MSCRGHIVVYSLMSRRWDFRNLVEGDELGIIFEVMIKQTPRGSHANGMCNTKKTIEESNRYCSRFVDQFYINFTNTTIYTTSLQKHVGFSIRISSEWDSIPFAIPSEAYLSLYLNFVCPSPQVQVETKDFET